MRVLAFLGFLAACGSPPSSKPADPVVMGHATEAGTGTVAKVSGPIELLAEPLGDGHLRVGLHNLGSAPIKVATYIATHEWQHDWLSIEIGDRTVKFWDSRDKSGPVFVDLAAGATDWQDVDVAGWAARSVNGGTPLPAGHHDVTITYDSTRESDPVWRGTLSVQAGLDV